MDVGDESTVKQFKRCCTETENEICNKHNIDNLFNGLASYLPLLFHFLSEKHHRDRSLNSLLTHRHAEYATKTSLAYN